jgi:hypothetical protein
LKLLGEGLKPFPFRGERVIDERFPFNGAQVLDRMLVLAAPEDESAFGDAEFFGDTGETNALRTQFDKLLNRFLLFHNHFWQSGVESLTGATPVDSVNPAHRIIQGLQDKGFQE